MEHFYDVLKKCIADHHPNFGDGESVLTLLYEAYSECNRLDDAQIKADFNELYQLMNGMELRDMDKIIYPVCRLCRDHACTRIRFISTDGNATRPPPTHLSYTKNR